MSRVTTGLIVFSACILLLIASAVVASEDDISRHRSCSYCGMDRKMYGYSRMLIDYEDGTQTGLCSLHCAVTEMNAHKEKRISSLQVADRNSHELIPAEKAIWIIGGSKRGVMTARAKWAFAAKESAEKFVSAYGGKVVSWEAALAAAQAEAQQ